MPKFRIRTVAPFPELQAVYDFRDALVHAIADHRNTTYNPAIIIVDGAVTYEPDYVPPIELTEAIRETNATIERELPRLMEIRERQREYERAS